MKKFSYRTVGLAVAILLFACLVAIPSTRDAQASKLPDRIIYFSGGEIAPLEDSVDVVVPLNRAEDYHYDKTDAESGHTYQEQVIKPTCTEGGYTLHTCIACEHCYTTDEVAATGHSYQAVVTAPTCTAKGYTTYTCHCCDSYIGNETAILSHSYEAVIFSVQYLRRRNLYAL